MTTLAHRSALRRPSRGGVAARRPLIRWAWRLFRREWRQQLLVMTLLTVAVAAAIGSVTIAYNSVPADTRSSARPTNCSRSTAPIRESSRRDSTPPRNGSERSTSSAIARCLSPAASTRWSSGPRSRAARTAASCSRSAEAATRCAPARSPSPTGWRSLCGSRSGRPWRSTGDDGPSWASSRTRAS